MNFLICYSNSTLFLFIYYNFNSADNTKLNASIPTEISRSSPRQQPWECEQSGGKLQNVRIRGN